TPLYADDWTKIGPRSSGLAYRQTRLGRNKAVEAIASSPSSTRLCRRAPLWSRIGYATEAMCPAIRFRAARGQDGERYSRHFPSALPASGGGDSPSRPAP